MDFIKRFLPSGLERYLEGIEFPITKEAAVSKMEENGVPETVLKQARERLPEGEYQSPRDLLSALKR